MEGDLAKKRQSHSKRPSTQRLVSRRGETHVDVIGTKAARCDATRHDTIFRITSKLVTAVATMILLEECKPRLGDPVDRLKKSSTGLSIRPTLVRRDDRGAGNPASEP